MICYTENMLKLFKKLKKLSRYFRFKRLKSIRRKHLYLAGGILISAVLLFNCLILLNYRSNNVTFYHRPHHLSHSAAAATVTNYQVPILMYHYIRIVSDPNDTLGQNLSVSPENFSSQAKWLRDNNYVTIKVADLADKDKKAISDAVSQNKKPIILTFDDGYDDAYTAAMPILQQNGFIGTFYIIRNFVGRPGYLTQDEIAKMAAAGMEIGSHTLDHPDLTKIPESSARAEIDNSKMGALTFCYPSGKYNATTISLLKAAGYVAAVSELPGFATEKSNPYLLPRVRMTNMSISEFQRRVQNPR